MSSSYLVYPDVQERPAFFINPQKMDPVKQYMKHYENYKFLKFIEDNPKTNGIERRQANKELIKASQKLEYWFKMAKMDRDAIKEVESQKKVVDQRWASK